MRKGTGGDPENKNTRASESKAVDKNSYSRLKAPKRKEGKTSGKMRRKAS